MSFLPTMSLAPLGAARVIALPVLGFLFWRSARLHTLKASKPAKLW